MNSINNRISRLALGTVQFGLEYGISNKNGRTSLNEVRDILQIAFQSGIDTLDTASSYGDSETAIGASKRAKFNIVSKFPASINSDAELSNSLATSLANTKSDCLYGYMAHDADALIKNKTLWQSMKQFRDAGKVQKIGYSLYTPLQLEALYEMGLVPDIVQVPYNFLDRRFEIFFDQLKSDGCEIHVRSVFLQGLFFLGPKELGEFFKPIKPLLGLLQEHFSDNKTTAAFLINFVLSNPLVDKLVFGVNTTLQLQENIDALSKETEYPNIQYDSNIPEEILMPNKWPS